MIFLGELEDTVATSSEDGTIKIWDLKKNICTVTLRGHSSDVWCLAAAAFSFNARNLLRGAVNVVSKLAFDENLFLFSGGNDGSVKSWSVNAHSIASPEDPTATTRALLMPQIPVHPSLTVMICGNNHLDSIFCTNQCDNVESARVAASRSRRSNGVCAVKLDPSGQFGIVCLCEGGIWLVNFAYASFASKVAAASTFWSEEKSIDKESKAQPSGPQSSTFAGGDELYRGWTFLINLDKGVTNADVDFKNCEIGSEGGESFYFFRIFCAHPDGFITLLKVSPKASGPEKEGSSLYDHQNLVVERKAWQAHNLRAINVWHLCADVHRNGVQETAM